MAKTRRKVSKKHRRRRTHKRGGNSPKAVNPSASIKARMRASVKKRMEEAAKLAKANSEGLLHAKPSAASRRSKKPVVVEPILEEE